MIYIGPENLRRHPQATVFNSRQSKYPRGCDNWITATGKAVVAAGEKQMTILTSLGMNTWEILLTYASKLNTNVIILMPGQDTLRTEQLNEIRERFQLSERQTGFMFPCDSDGKSRRELMQYRDRRIAELSDVIYPVAVRNQGMMESLLGEYREKVAPAYSIPYGMPSRLRPRYDEKKFNNRIIHNNMIVHFTRSNSEPWPGESEYQYYSGIINSGEEYYHSAGNSLLHILRDKKISASCRNIRGGFRVVGFAGINEENAASLFRYRSRLVNPYFEPFGICLSEKDALRFGIKPVVYGPPRVYSRLSNDTRPFYQNCGSFGEQWRLENEWRHRGDFDFSHIPSNIIKIVVPKEADIKSIQENTDSEVIALFA